MILSLLRSLVDERSIVAVHGIETCSPKTWTAFEKDEEPRGRGVNWLVDEDILPRVVPQARIWVFDYNSNYSRNAQVIGIKNLGETLLSFITMEKLGTRPIVFIGSCFGGIVITQVGFLRHASSEKCRIRRDTLADTFHIGTSER